MSRGVLLFLALFAGAALAQSAVEAQKADAAAYNHGEHNPEYYDADHEYYGHDHDDYHKGGKHGKHTSKSHSKPYKLTITFDIRNPDFFGEGGLTGLTIGPFLEYPRPLGENGVFLFDLYESADANANKVGNGVITGTFYQRDPADQGTAIIVSANEVATINLTGGDFMGSKLSASGTLAFKPGANGQIQRNNDLLVVNGGTKDLTGAAGTIQFVGGAGDGGARAILKLTVPKHYADHNGY